MAESNRKRLVFKVSKQQLKELRKRAEAQGLGLSSYVSFVLARGIKAKEAPKTEKGELANGHLVDAYLFPEHYAQIKKISTETGQSLGLIIRYHIF